MKSKLCVYHGNCADGFTAAWVVRKKFGEEDVEFVAGVYGEMPFTPADLHGRDVIVADFSYPRSVMEQIVRFAKSVTVLDHHKTARDALANLEGATVVFDMERSGAGIAWDYFFPGEVRPRMIDYVEDRDLWRFKYEPTRAIHAAIFSFEYTFENWDLISEDITKGIAGIADEGRAIERKHFKDIKELCKVVTRTMEIGGHAVPVANLPYTLSSDAGHLLAAGHPFAACYWDTPTGRVFSLRSREGGADVSLIAKAYGGGGHANASGFRVPYGHPLATAAGGTNYVADREVNPTQIKFANGRRVWINADGGLDTDFAPLNA